MRTLVQTDRLIVSRCADPDDQVFTQTALQPGANAWLAANQVSCWCSAVGSCTLPDAVFVVAAFAPSQLHALRQPRTELELSDYSVERGTLESAPMAAFGLRLRVTATPMVGQLSIGLREVTADPPAPLTAVDGTVVRASCFLLSGMAAERLLLPPPMSTGTYRGQPRCNAETKVWCGVGESDTLVVCAADNLPRVPPTALLVPPFDAPATAPEAVSSAASVVAVGLLLERCGSTASVDDFEHQTIRALLHRQHAEQDPAAAVPPYARALADNKNALSAALALCGNRARVAWMQPATIGQ